MRFDKPVNVALGLPGCEYRKVDDAYAAAVVLVKDWPGDHTAKHQQARQAALNAMENEQDQRLAVRARQAFEQAALEANILRPTYVQPTGTPSIPKWHPKRRQHRDI